MTAAVARLPVLASFTCPACSDRRAQWQVGPTHRSCGRCLDVVLRVAIREGDGFTPTVVEPIGATA